jgi:tetratricopeptide (TPR) repeat protein
VALTLLLVVLLSRGSARAILLAMAGVFPVVKGSAFVRGSSTLSACFGIWKHLVAARDLYAAVSPQKEGLWRNLEYFKKVFAARTFGSGEACDQIVQAAVSLRQASVPDEVKMGFLSLARSQALRETAQFPSDAKIEPGLGTLLATNGLYDEADRHLLRTQQLSPKKQTVLFQLGAARIGQGDPAGALPYLRPPYDEAPDYPVARSLFRMTASPPPMSTAACTTP